ncbi:TPA: aspartate--tRNA(Asn) ligase, partial [Candidatus Collierbacteria bacterium]|nr:aspartate--tRNA(Asn) ligase [Candidatus Collierbacteria bacterium]
EKGLTDATIGDYLNFFRYGCPPHGGLGAGPSRFIMKMLGIDNIREATYLYRGVKRLTP